MKVVLVAHHDGAMDDETRRAVALFRVGVLGPLVSARLEHGDRIAYFAAAAARDHVLPDGRVVRLSARTIEAWLYAYRHGGFDALMPERRSDRGACRAIAPDVADLILRAKREKPRRSIRRIIRMLERAGVVAGGTLTKSSVHRLLAASGISARPLRGPACERRSFLAEHAGDLCIGDALHVAHPVLGPDGTPKKTYLLSQIDNATRFIVHSYLAHSEDAPHQEYGFKEALRKAGLFRVDYVDLGAAYVAHSLVEICGELGIHLQHAGPGDAEAKGAIERWHRTWREEVEDELPPGPIPIGELQAIHWAWLGAEYHARKHDTTGRAPRDHFVAEAEHIRPLPPGKDLDQVFLHRQTRTVRNDGTVRWGGGFLEVRPELRGRIELRYDPMDDSVRPRVFIDGRFHSDTVPLDRHANMYRTRRRVAGEADPRVVPTGLDPLAQLRDEHYRRTRPVRGDDIDDDQED